MKSSSASTRFSALSARSSTRFKRASIRNSGSPSVSVAVLVALTDFFRGGDSGSYGCVRFRGRPRVLVTGAALVAPVATDCVVVRTVFLRSEQFELIRIALGAALVVPWHFPISQKLSPPCQDD